MVARLRSRLLKGSKRRTRAAELYAPCASCAQSRPDLTVFGDTPTRPSGQKKKPNEATNRKPRAR
jgi:hypothetical protein